jgi:1-acyl-sn-glycerol-3-phosphate acyltransferase
MLNGLIRFLFWMILVKPLVFIGLGLNIINKKALSLSGPCILAPNHNSHLDTIVLMSLYPFHLLSKVRPVAAADYFLKNKFYAWFSLKIIGIVPLDRSGQAAKEDLFDACEKALRNNDILILFPEGSRGDPEKMTKLKKGIYHLAKKCEGSIIQPIFMKGLGRSLPKGEGLLVPFNCDIVIGEGISASGSADELIEKLNEEYSKLSNLCLTKNDEVF